MLRHYITKYEEDGELWAESWLQVDLFGRCWCLSRRRIQLVAGQDDWISMSLSEKGLSYFVREHVNRQMEAVGRGQDEGGSDLDSLSEICELLDGTALLPVVVLLDADSAFEVYDGDAELRLAKLAEEEADGGSHDSEQTAYE